MATRRVPTVIALLAALGVSPTRAQNCNILTGGNPCAAGCPDECSPILCAFSFCGRAVCQPQCNILCGGDACGSGCPDECSAVICGGNTCSRGKEGAACGPLFPCQDGLRCAAFVCQRPRTIGEGCLLSSDCADGLACQPCFVDGCQTPLTCFPSSADHRFDEAECSFFYSPALHQAAIDRGLTTTYGYGSAISAVVGGSFQVGVAYGQDGSYGCYGTTCTGLTAQAEIGSFTSVGFYESPAALAGVSVAVVQEVDIGPVSFSTSQVLNQSGRLIGTEDCLSLELSVQLPISPGVYNCETSTVFTSVNVPGVTTTTVDSTSTTLPVIGRDPAMAALDAALPDPDALESGPEKRLARKLRRLYAAAARFLERGDAAGGPRQERLYRQAAQRLKNLVRLAKRGEKRSRLVGPLPTIVTLVEVVLRWLPGRPA